MGCQVTFESMNVLAQSNVSRYREFQVDGAATESKVAHGSVPARCDTIEWLWSECLRNGTRYRCSYHEIGLLLLLVCVS